MLPVNPELEIRLRLNQQAEWRRQAENKHLARVAQANWFESRRYLPKILLSIGVRLVTWGETLQKRYNPELTRMTIDGSTKNAR